MRYQDVEGILYSYNLIKQRIEKLELDKRNLYDTYITSSGGPMDGQPRGSEMSDPTGGSAEKIMVRRQKIQKEINRERHKIILIDGAMEILNATERKIITVRYIEGKSWDYVADFCGFSKRHTMRIAKNGLETMFQVLK